MKYWNSSSLIKSNPNEKKIYFITVELEDNKTNKSQTKIVTSECIFARYSLMATFRFHTVHQLVYEHQGNLWMVFTETPP